MKAAAITAETIQQRIFMIRGMKVMIDADLGDLYDVSTKALNQAVKRNPGRFPADFAFRLTNNEKNRLVTNCDRFRNLKHSSAMPFVFTEQGVAMLSSVLKSSKSVRVNVEIIPTVNKDVRRSA